VDESCITLLNCDRSSRDWRRFWRRWWISLWLFDRTRQKSFSPCASSSIFWVFLSARR